MRERSEAEPAPHAHRVVAAEMLWKMPALVGTDAAIHAAREVRYIRLKSFEKHRAELAPLVEVDFDAAVAAAFQIFCDAKWWLGAGRYIKTEALYKQGAQSCRTALPTLPPVPPPAITVVVDEADYVVDPETGEIVPLAAAPPVRRNAATDRQVIADLCARLAEIETERDKIEAQRDVVRAQIAVMLQKIGDEMRVPGFGKLRLTEPTLTVRYEREGLDELVAELRLRGQTDIADAIVRHRREAHRAGYLSVRRDPTTAPKDDDLT